jgi:DNA-binding NtrC family response regulator
MDACDRPVSSAKVALAIGLLGESMVFRRLLAQIERFARCEATVLIYGETGTGKELAARAIHYLSSRHAGPFIPINCGSIPDALISSELFGYSRGAFTDAREAHAGLIAQAEGGTLFLDEVETLTPRAQVSLLRFLQDHEYRPLGAGRARNANVRVLGATNVDLSELSRRKEFRSDLLYRLNVLSLTVPPLRQRGDDIVRLANVFLDRLHERYGGCRRTLSRDAIEILRAHNWPGNVRELESLIHREFLLADDHDSEIRLTTMRSSNVLPERSLHAPPDTQNEPASALTHLGFREAKEAAIAAFERAYISELLTRTSGNVSHAARLAGKERSRLGRLVRKYKFSADQFKSCTSSRTSL